MAARVFATVDDVLEPLGRKRGIACVIELGESRQVRRLDLEVVCQWSVAPSLEAMARGAVDLKEKSPAAASCLELVLKIRGGGIVLRKSATTRHEQP